MDALKKLWARHGVALSEPGTWRGFVTILSALGIALNPDQMNAIVVVGLAITGLLNVFFKDESNPAAVLQTDKDKALNEAASLDAVVKGTRE
jgi:hypothetical protein